MQITQTLIEDCYEILPNVFEDDRGYFFESFNKQKFENLTGCKVNFVQDNRSFSTKGVLRGLHFQKGMYAQAKLVQVTAGEVLDVAVDLRRGSKSFGKVFSTVLSEANKKQLFIPRGCAHGFVVLSSTASFFYKCDNYYHQPSEGGIIYNDSSLQIDWKFGKKNLVISDKDKKLPTLEEYLKLETTF